MRPQVDRYLFTQIGLDSGALTMLGCIVRSFPEPGEYRGTVRTGDVPDATFVLSVDKACAIAQATIDLAALARGAPTACGCTDTGTPRFTVHPKGYVVFHVSGGAGGYSATVRRADEDPELKAYNTRTLESGDIFAAMLLQPGTYALRNAEAVGEVTVAHPAHDGETEARQRPPVAAECGDVIEPRGIALQSAQGLVLHATAPARIVIELVKPGDGAGAAA
jgi:hypothetical protein